MADSHVPMTWAQKRALRKAEKKQREDREFSFSKTKVNKTVPKIAFTASLTNIPSKQSSYFVPSFVRGM